MSQEINDPSQVQAILQEIENVEKQEKQFPDSNSATQNINPELLQQILAQQQSVQQIPPQQIPPQQMPPQQIPQQMPPQQMMDNMHGYPMEQMPGGNIPMNMPPGGVLPQKRSKNAGGIGGLIHKAQTHAQDCGMLLITNIIIGMPVIMLTLSKYVPKIMDGDKISLVGVSIRSLIVSVLFLLYKIFV